MEGAQLLNFYGLVPNRCKNEIVFLLMERNSKGEIKTFCVPMEELEQFAPEGEKFNYMWIYAGAVSSMIVRKANCAKITGLMR
jgi:hypothetical protein